MAYALSEAVPALARLLGQVTGVPSHYLDADPVSYQAAPSSNALLASSPPPTCKPHHSTIETSLSLFLCMGLVVSYLPQIIRFIWKKSSLGFSPWFLFLGTTSSASSFLNVVSLQWAVVSCCQWLPYGACFESLLGIVQVGLQWLLLMIVAILFLVYYPKELRFERSIALAGSDRYDDSDASDEDLDSLDSHIAENYAVNGNDSTAAGLSPSAIQEGAAVSGVSSSYDGHSPDASGLASRITLDDEDEIDERSSSAFSRLVPTFWPVWKAPRKYAPSPLSKVSNDDAGEQLPANATSQARLAVSSASPSHEGSGHVPTSATPEHNDEAEGAPHVRIQVPINAFRRKRRVTKVRSQEWSLALSLAWLVVFHFVFILSVTLLLVFSLPPSSFPQPPQKSEANNIMVTMGPSSRLLVTRWATFLGWTAMLLAACQYLPQIVYTARSKLVGSLSIPMMCLQVPGSALFIYSLALKPGVNYTSLAAYICTGVLQSVLLGLCFAWRLRERKLGIDDFGRPLAIASDTQDNEILSDARSG